MKKLSLEQCAKLDKDICFLGIVKKAIYHDSMSFQPFSQKCIKERYPIQFAELAEEMNCNTTLKWEERVEHQKKVEALWKELEG